MGWPMFDEPKITKSLFDGICELTRVLYSRRYPDRFLKHQGKITRRAKQGGPDERFMYVFLKPSKGGRETKCIFHFRLSASFIRSFLRRNPEIEAMYIYEVMTGRDYNGTQ